MLGSILVSFSLAETREAPAAMISLVFRSDLDHVVARGFGLEDGVIDQCRDAGVDPGQFLAGRDARGAGGDDLLGVPRARLHAALHATGAHLIGQVESLALPGRGSRRYTGRDT